MMYLDSVCNAHLKSLVMMILVARFVVNCIQASENALGDSTKFKELAHQQLLFIVFIDDNDVWDLLVKGDYWARVIPAVKAVAGL